MRGGENSSSLLFTAERSAGTDEDHTKINSYCWNSWRRSQRLRSRRHRIQSRQQRQGPVRHGETRQAQPWRERLSACERALLLRSANPITNEYLNSNYKPYSVPEWPIVWGLPSSFIYKSYLGDQGLSPHDGSSSLHDWIRREVDG